MRILALVLLFCAAAYGADTVTTNVVGDVTTRISERTDTNGNLTVRVETSYRGKEKVLQVIKQPIAGGKMGVNRAYLVGSKLAFDEEDDDGDGVFEGMTAQLPGTDDIEMFTREPGGNIKPASTERIRLTKEQSEITDQSLEKLLFQKKKLSDAEIDQLLNKNRETVAELENQELTATNTADITTQVYEHQAADGKPDFRDEICRRGKSKILETVSCSDQKGRMSVWTRNYCIGGRIIATECDDNGDGFFERLILYRSGTDDIEAFWRHTDGTVTPATTVELDAINKESTVVLTPLYDLLLKNPKKYDEKFGKTLADGRRKIQELEKTNGLQ